MALLLRSLTGYFGQLKANVILISFEEKQRAWEQTVSAFLYFSMYYHHPSGVIIIIIIFVIIIIIIIIR